MSLELKRITHPYEAMKCDITKKLLSYGDYYYEDINDGTVIDAIYYRDRKHQQKLFDSMDEFNDAYSPEEYRLKMREAERRFLEATILDKKVLTAQDYNLDNKDNKDVRY